MKELIRAGKACITSGKALMKTTQEEDVLRNIFLESGQGGGLISFFFLSIMY